MTPEDPYSRLDYRRLIAWPERIAREEPFLRKVLATAPSPRLLDLGCGTGEHSRFLASLGHDVTGVDASPDQLEKARESGEGPSLRFVRADLAQLRGVLSGTYGAAICLGNTFPHLADRASALGFLSALAAVLAPGAPFLLQILNYDRVHDGNVRSLPLSFRPDGEETVVFLRLMEPRPDGTVLFNPTTLVWRPGSEPPVAVAASRNVLLRGWRRAEVEALLSETGWAVESAHGGMREEPADPAAADLVLVARRL